MTLEEIQRKVDKAEEARIYARKRGLECRKAYNEVKARYVAVQRAQEIIQSVAQQIQTKAYSSVARVVSKCLQSVFDEPYELSMVFNRKRGRTEVEISFKRDGHVIDPMSASGGGVVDVASFALRLSSILLSAGRTRRLLVLDEPFKFVSSLFQPNVRAMLETVSREMDFQIIMVTHIDEYRLGTVIDLNQG